MINAKKQIEDGSDINLNLKSNFTNLVDEATKTDNEIEYK